MFQGHSDVVEPLKEAHAIRRRNLEGDIRYMIVRADPVGTMTLK